MMTVRWKDVGLVWLALMLAAAYGCAFPANPGTFVTYNAWTGSVKVEDSSNKEVEVTGLEIDIPNKVCRLESLKITQEVSSVRQANAEQLAAFAEQTKVVAGAISSSVASIASLLPGLGGGGGGGGAVVDSSCPT